MRQELCIIYTRRIIAFNCFAINQCRCHILFFNTGVTGKIYVDDNGDRRTNFKIMDMNPTTGRFEVIICPRTLLEGPLIRLFLCEKYHGEIEST